ncbi:hypothetical protein V2J09_006027 [Rumex salicifolius]
MGCTSSLLQGGCMERKKMTIQEVVVFVPVLWIPSQTDLKRALKGLIPRDLTDQLVALRNRIILVADDTDGSAIVELNGALEEYLPIFLGLTMKGLEDAVDFKWRNLDDGRQEACLSNSWFELLCVIYMLAVLALSEANLLLIPKDSGESSERIVSLDGQRDAIDLLLKAAGYLDFCLKAILAHLAPDTKEKLPADLQEGVLQALSTQAIGQATELQLGLAVENQKATLSVKRRLACEELTFFSQAHCSLSVCKLNNDNLKKHSAFIKWKFLEAKAAAYYYHGLVLDKGSEPQCHVSAVYCFLAAEEILSESKKSCLSFSLASPVTRPPPFWGLMKHLYQKIPDMASKKSQMYSYLLDHEKDVQVLPELPEFHLSLRPEDYELPALDPSWNKESWEFRGQPLKDHLEDSEDEGHIS